jgi:hypothetical protein
MLIFPLLPYLVEPNSSVYHSKQYRMPDRKKTLSRAASVLVSFSRDLWKLTRGDIDNYSYEIIDLFLQRVHSLVGLPKEAIFQGRVYGHDDLESTLHYPDIAVKFSVGDHEYLRKNPDLLFASRYVTHMSIRVTQDVELSAPFRKLSAGQSIIVRNKKGWRFLEDMGYVRIVGIPGEVIELVGAAARDAYLFASEPSLREVEVISTLDTHQLVAACVISEDESVEYRSYKEFEESRFDVNLQSWRYRKYVDLDDPKSAGFYGKSREWIDDGLQDTRSSLSPEPASIELDY